MSGIARGALLGRAALLVLLLLALWNPQLARPKNPMDLFMLWDDSASVRGRATNAAWRAMGETVGGLPPGSRVGVVRFAAEPTWEPAPRPAEGASQIFSGSPHGSAPQDPESTDIGAALDLALGATTPNRSTAILMATDGEETGGDATRALESARAWGVPVYALRIEGSGERGDSWIESAHIQKRGRVGSPLSVTAFLSTAVARRARLELSVDGRVRDEAAVDLAPGRAVPIGLSFTPERPGPVEASLVLLAPGDPVRENNAVDLTSFIAGPSTVLYVARDRKTAPLALSLKVGGWEVVRSAPAALAQDLDAPAPPSMVVLDDLAIADVPDLGWAALERAVRLRGTGLVVLGGPHSFGAGAYRGSALESILPVTVETGRERRRTAVVFVIDTSGSMGEESGGAPPLALARAAVASTAAVLAPGDLVGAIGFDVAPRELLPLAYHPDLAHALGNAWRGGASGGTRVAPALTLAARWLSDSGAELRIVILLTDGHVGDDSSALSALATQMAKARLLLIPLAVGRDAETDALRLLAGPGTQAVLRVAQAAELPAIVQQELSRRTRPPVEGTITPRELRPLPFLPDNPRWPALTGYALTRARPGATVYLDSPTHDPLLAFWHAGAGAVAALPAGLSEWAASWTRWSLWGRLCGGLVEWVSRDADDPLLRFTVSDRPGALVLLADALTPELQWWSEGRGAATVVGPSSLPRETVLEPVAPGRYQGRLPTEGPGRYQATLRLGDRVARGEGIVSVQPEFFHENDHRDPIASWVRQGLLIPWTPGDRITGSPVADSSPKGSRPLLLGIAAALYLGLLAAERVGLRIVAGGRRLRAAARRRMERWSRISGGSADRGVNRRGRTDWPSR